MPKSQRLGPLPSLDKASWIWRAPNDDICQFRIAFTLEESPAAASILITADNGYELYINGAAVGYDIGAGGEVWSSVQGYDITRRLARGRNVIGVRGTDLGGIRGLVAAARIDVKGRPPLEIVTDSSWRVAAQGDPVDYSHPEFVEGNQWTKARVLGKMGMAPWGKLAYAGSTGGRRPTTLHSSIALTNPDKDFQALSGEGVYLPMGSGDFMLLWPQDAHMPGMAAESPVPVKKVVVKIAVE